MRKAVRLRRFGLLLSTSMMAGLAVNTAAQAQSTPAPVPLSRSPIDENGVNLATGGMQLPAGGLAIGAAGRLGYTLYGVGGSALGMKNSYAIAESTTGGLIIGPSGKTFSSGVATDGSGETYANGVYTMRDGTKIDIAALAPPSPPPGPSGPYDVFNAGPDIYFGAGGAVKGLASKITYPDGEVINIHYRIDTIYHYQYYYYPPSVTVKVTTAYRHIRIQSVTSNRGYQLKYSYASNTTSTNGNDPFAFGFVTGVTAINNAVDYCSPTADTCSGLTQSWPTLTSSVNSYTTTITDPLGRATIYKTDSNGRLNGIQRPSSSSDDVTIAYDGNGRVSSLTRDGVAYTYAFSLAGTVLTGVVSGPNGTIRTTTADTSTGTVLSVKDALNKTTSYQPDSSGRITQVTYPEGNYDSITYDGRGNVTQKVSVAKSGSGLANIVISAGYAASCTNVFTCNKPNWTKDAEGYQTDFTYDAANGNLLTVTVPAASGSAPVGSGTRPKTTYSYTNQQAYYKNSAGSIVASGTSISLLTGVSQCQTGASCAGTADEVLATVSYGPQTAGTANNLLPVSSTVKAGNNSVSATTAMSYDAVGNLVTVDGPLSGTADTTHFRYDAARQRVGVVGPDPDGAGARKRGGAAGHLQ